MRRNGVSNAIAAGFLVAGILIGLTGYYVATNLPTKIETQTETTTATQTLLAATTSTLVAAATPLESLADLSVVTVACSVSGTNPSAPFTGTAAANTCFLSVFNSGTAKGYVTGCSIGGVTGTLSDATSTAAASITIAGSGPVRVECTATTSYLGAALSGLLTTVGLAVSFAGTWAA